MKHDCNFPKTSPENFYYFASCCVMLPKTPKSKFGFWKFVKGGAKTLFIIEAVCFAASYGVYHRMNTNREFRLYINENFPFALDYYYQIGELIGNSNIRQVDAAIWKAEDKKSE